MSLRQLRRRMVYEQINGNHSPYSLADEFILMFESYMKEFQQEVEDLKKENKELQGELKKNQKKLSKIYVKNMELSTLVEHSFVKCEDEGLESIKVELTYEQLIVLDTLIKTERFFQETVSKNVDRATRNNKSK